MKLSNPLRHPPGVPRVEKPRAEGRFHLADGRGLGYAEFGDPTSPVVLRPTSAKLRRRAVRIVRDAAGVDEEAAATALAAAGGHAKTAIVALLAGVDAAEAAVRLDRVRGRVVSGVLRSSLLQL
jgi:hypothetical protein